MNTNTLATIRAIYRYPVKGLPAEPSAATALTPGETRIGDRCYAIENGPSGFDPAMPRYLPAIINLASVVAIESMVGLPAGGG